ncbi:unnamed protein product [Owenia fusiformis]|uniref:VWFA domain-containing protein n=1 Tax=Owenia fusiformis TaxID=6347 RepID=A0A8S4PCU5_OWEFU|nr:unnamed protein product [Owenia fusiformis]
MDLKHILVLTLCVFVYVLSEEDEPKKKKGAKKKTFRNKFLHVFKNERFHITDEARDAAFRECNPFDFRYIYDVEDDDFEPDNCHYMECVDKKYEQKECADGKQVSLMFKRRYDFKGRGSSSNPCTQPSQLCKRSLADKGILPIDVKICGIELVFNVDISCSITMADKKKVQKFIWRAVRSLPIRSVLTQVGILTFAKSVIPVAHLNSYPRKKNLLKAVDEMQLDVPQSECGTSTWLALKNAREEYFHEDNGLRPDRTKVMIVITDGETWPNDMKEETLREAKLNQAAGIISFVIALPNIKLQGLAGQDEWRAIATGDGDDNIFYMESFNQLSKYHISEYKYTSMSIWCLITVVCVALPPTVLGNRFVHNIFDLVPGGVSQKFHRVGEREEYDKQCNLHEPNARFMYHIPDLNIEPDDCHYFECVGQHYERKQCEDGKSVSDMMKYKYNYTGKGQNFNPCTKPNTKCKRTLADKGIVPLDVKVCGIDLVFAVDISCSITMENKQIVKQFIYSAAKLLRIRSVYTLMGILSFAKTVYPVAHMNSYTRKRQLLNAIADMNLEIKGEDCGTSTWLALKNAREEYFHEDNGMREGYQNVLIVITDGETYPANMTSETKREAAINHMPKYGIKSMVIALPNIRRFGLSGIDEWQAIASGDGDENIFNMNSFQQLKESLNMIIKRACKIL